MYTADPNMQRDELGCYLAVDESGMVTDMEVDPTHPNLPLTSMEVVVMKRELLRTLVDKGVAHGYHDFNRDVLLRAGDGRHGARECVGVYWSVLAHGLRAELLQVQYGYAGYPDSPSSVHGGAACVHQGSRRDARPLWQTM